ncbi:V-type ATP synthase subunit D [Alteromonas facilis]|uniref:V-type ATP synthase subunit D n=1 Tax=Alteromonas facilis TaxID=2048004 RepID=UPI000C28FD4A|nr:V-type ATP synthase subunit D [Alteromonas facilis]
MARLQLNKSALAKESHNLKTYQRFLPSLDLKRQQLMAERANARNDLVRLEQENAVLLKSIADKAPMLANSDISLENLVSIADIEIDEENIVGTRLPVLTSYNVVTKPYSYFSKPHWVDYVCRQLAKALLLDIQLQVQRKRIKLLEKAVSTITQRVNLFDKVLIPKAKDNIKRIRIYLSDEQMVSVVRSKIAKRKHAQRRVE